MLTFATFGAGFLMPPLGAIFLGAYIDQIGRRKGLILTLGIMATGTALLAFTPSFQTIGILAPIIVLFGRLLQGFSVGVELGGVSVYLAEMATPKNKGFYVSWQSASQQLAIVFSALLGFAINKYLSKDVISDWGWRIPFFIGCLIIPVVFQIRRSLLAYSLATALFGGFTPLVSTWLIEKTSDKAAPGFWLSFAGAMGLIATFLIYRGIVKEKKR